MSFWKNYLTRLMIRILKLFERAGNNDHFLIVSTTGLGDTLWATPAIRALREAHPKAYIGCLTSRLGRDVLMGNLYLNELLVWRPFSLLKLYFQLRKRKIGTVLFFHTSQRALLPLCSVIGACRRIGTLGLQKGLDALLTKALVWNGSHEIERRLDLVREVGAHPQNYDLDFLIEGSDRMEAKKLLPAGVVIGLHPGAKDKFKQWPPSHFVKVARALKEEIGCSIVITGSPSEKNLVESICREVGGAVPFIHPLKTMAAAVEQLSLFITNDTGPLHLALAMKTATVTLFAPTNHHICGPYHNDSAVVIQKAPTCFPCLKKKCLDPFCMQQIGPAEVIQAALEKLRVSV